MDIGRGWSFLEWVLCSGLESSQWGSISPGEDLKSSILACSGMIDLLEEWLYEKIFQDLNMQVRPQFWDYFGKSEPDSDYSKTFGEAMGYLHGVFSNRYLVAIRRLQWIQTLAASAPATTIRDMGAISSASASAFTPVKANIKFDRDDGGRLQGPRKLNPLFSSFEDEKKTSKSTNVRRQSVTFEKGTKGGQMSSEEEEEIEDSIDGEKGGNNDSMDGSYVDDKNVAEKLMFSDSSSQDMSFPNPAPTTTSNTSHLLTKNHQQRVGQILRDEEEEEESFIRSPIGGNKKLMSSTHTTGSSSTISKSLFASKSSESESDPAFPEGRHTSIDSSTSTLRAMSQTSTPGFALHLTPGSITPIAQSDSNTPFISSQGVVSDTPEMQGLQSNTTVFTTEDNLPNASTVFGISLPSRPVPGLSVRWPKDDSDSHQARLSTMMRAALFYTFPEQFLRFVQAFYSNAFDLHKLGMDSAEQLSELQERKIRQERFEEVNRQMESMGLMERIASAAVTEIVHSQIEKHITHECKGNFDSSYLNYLEEWLDQLVLGWLTTVLNSNKKSAGHPVSAGVKAFRDRLYHFLYETYARSLIGQLFDIIIDYPDSKPAIQDLCSCLEKTDLRSELVSTLKSALESRLLHPGVNTADILTAYIAAIKALRLLEPAGVILELVCEPVRRYLRSREDTVRCIVASLTDEGNNELISELVNVKPSEEENGDDGSMKDWDSWVPDPVDADPSIVSKNRRTADILSTLVNIYGSKELFVNEYRALLADRILMQYNYDEQRELRYLELLKLRFGEAQLHFCEVMLRDVTESRRVNTRIQESKNMAEVKPDDIDMNAMILSAQFWPAFRDEKITLPAELQAHLDKYTKSFEAQKQNRTLVWKQHLGIMNIELELKEETLNFSVSPVLAAIIMKFQEKTKWSVEELSSDLEMTATVIRRKISFWQGQGLLKEVAPDQFQLVEERRGRPHELVMVDEEEVESAMASAQQQKEEEMQVFWTYIQGMLSNLDCLPLERIHSMLRMFVMEEPSSNEISLQELKSFLDNKVKDQILVFSGGVYRLNKDKG